MKQLRKSWWSISLALLLLLVLAATAFATSSLGVTGPCYLILSPSTTADTMQITWWDVPEVTAGSVQYSVSADFATNPAAVVATAQAVLNKNDTTAGYSSFTAVMTGLGSGCVYYYRVGNQDSWSQVKSLQTGDPANATQVSFLYLGDIQYNTFAEAESNYAAWGNLLAGAYAANPNLDFALLGGDMVQQGQLASNWQLFFNNATPVFSQLPVLAIPGNHESNSATTGKPELYLQLMAQPQNGPTGFEEEFYSYDYGNCHIVALSSSIFLNEQVLKGSMEEGDFTAIAQWLQADLAASNATWKIVVMHHPAYAVVSDSTAAAVLANWTPLFEQAQVDLVLCGHQHIYMRTKPMHGVTYVMGNSGSKHYGAAQVSYSACMIQGVSTYQRIAADEAQLVVTAYNAAGEALDGVTLNAKDRTVTPYSPEDNPGDLNSDQAVDGLDLALLLDSIRSNGAYDELKDLNNDGVVDICDAHKLALQIQGV